jgi:hypothetical protein
MTFKGFCSVSMCALFFIALSAFADTVHVEGEASFALRHTLVPIAIVRGDSAPKSQAYWAVVVKAADGKAYELNGQFALGQNVKPSQITLDGITVEENSKITLDGTITYQSGSYVWLDEVSDVQNFNSDHQVILIPQPTDPFLNWTCQGQMDSDTEVYADVWFQADPSSASKGSYTVRLSTAALQGDDRQFSELAYLDSARITVNAAQMTFNASSAQDSVTLKITNSDALEQAPGVMTFSVHDVPRDLGVSTVRSVSDLTVSCNRNR